MCRIRLLMPATIFLCMGLLSASPLAMSKEKNVGESRPTAKVKKIRQGGQKKKSSLKKEPRKRRQQRAQRARKRLAGGTVGGAVGGAVGLVAGLAATPVTALGLVMEGRVNRSWRFSLSYADGQVELDPDVLPAENLFSWEAKSAFVRGTKVEALAKWHYSKRSYVGFGVHQKVLAIDFVFLDPASDSRIALLASLKSQGLHFGWGTVFQPAKNWQLDVEWLGLDIPLNSEILVQSSDESVSVGVDDNFLSRQTETKTFIDQMKSIPFPTLLVAQASFRF